MAADLQKPQTKNKLVQDGHSNHLDPVQARWFAIYTHYKREKKVRDRLTKAGIENYLPVLHYTKRYTRKIRQVELPLIRSYVFVRITKADYLRVLQTPDVLQFVRFGRDLISIPEKEIDLLKRVVGEKTDLSIEAKTLHKGDPVEIIAGQLTGIKGIFEEALNPHNFVVILDTLGMELRMQIDPMHLAKTALGRRA